MNSTMIENLLIIAKYCLHLSNLKSIKMFLEDITLLTFINVIVSLKKLKEIAFQFKTTLYYILKKSQRNIKGKTLQSVL